MELNEGGEGRRVVGIGRQLRLRGVDVVVEGAGDVGAAAAEEVAEAEPAPAGADSEEDEAPLGGGSDTVISRSAALSGGLPNILARIRLASYSRISGTASISMVTGSVPGSRAARMIRTR